ncbi:outer membrane protein assembly factor BamE [Candidatus Pelagibacter sp.]|nr:outer membrane protein assembly factor BamE [Candidatus Pelagibacter sp.]
MKNLFIFILITLFFSACTLKKVENHHGVRALVKKQGKLIINKSNKNDILNLLGSPSTKSSFENDFWIYIERKTDNTSILKFSEERIVINNVLVLEINKFGLLEKKEFLDLNNMQDVKFTKEITSSEYKKTSFLYEFLTSLRQKINDPTNQKRKK